MTSSQSSIESSQKRNEHEQEGAQSETSRQQRSLAQACGSMAPSSDNAEGPHFKWTGGRNQHFEGPVELFWPVFAAYVLRVAADTGRAVLLALIAYLIARL